MGQTGVQRCRMRPGERAGLPEHGFHPDPWPWGVLLLHTVDAAQGHPLLGLCNAPDGDKEKKATAEAQNNGQQAGSPSSCPPLVPSPVPPSTPNHHPILSQPLPATHLALSTAIQGLLAPQGHTGPGFLPGRERFIRLQVQGQQALGRGVLGSRLLGGSGRQWGEAGQGQGVFPSQDAGSRWESSLGPRWQRALGTQAGRRGAGSCGPHPHHLMRVKMEVPTLRGSHVRRR